MSMNLKRYLWVVVPALMVIGVSVAKAVDDTAPPSTVSNLAITNATSTSAALSWSAPGDDGAVGTAAFYDLRYRTTGPIDEVNFATSTPVAGEPAPHAAGTLESFTVPGLSPTTTYWFGLRSTDDAGNTSGLSNAVATTTPADAAAPVISGVAVTDITANSAKVKWITNEIGSSMVQYGTTTGHGLQASSSGMVMSHVVPLTGLAPATGFHFIVSSADNFGHSATSSDSTFTTLATTTPDVAPPVISGVAVTDITQNSASVRWTTNEASNSLVRFGTTTAYGLSASLSSFVTSHIVPLFGLSPATMYHFSVSSADSSGNTATSSDHLFSTLATSTSATTTIQARLQMDPRTINRARKGKRVTATVRLPQGVTFEGLDTESVRLNGTVKPTDLRFRKQEWRWWGRVRRTMVLKFASDDILPLIPSSADQFTFTVTGNVKAGVFSGTDTVRVVPKASKPVSPPKLEKKMEDLDDKMEEMKERLEEKREEMEKKKEELEDKQEKMKKQMEKKQEQLQKKMEKLRERFDD